MKSYNVAKFGMFVALAFLLSYIESLFPIPIPVPGIKIGLANLVVICGLYTMGVKEAFVLSIIRIILVGFTFGNPSTMLFSMAGGILSWACMTLLSKVKSFSVIGVSVVGGIAHNVGQIMVAALVVNNIALVFYLPILLISGVITGAIIGFLGAIIVNTIKKT